MGIILNRRRVCGGGKSLPYDAEIEWLQATGTQYIDTGYVPKSNTELEIKYTVTKLPSNIKYGTFPFGCRVRFQYKAFNIFSPVNTMNECHLSFGSTNYVFNYKPLNKEIIAGVSGETMFLNEFTANFSGELPNLNIFLFGLNDNGRFSSGVNLELNIKHFWIKEDVQYVVDFIPVRKGNTGYMYDKVSGQLFGNAGTGSFILGPDK